MKRGNWAADLCVTGPILPELGNSEEKVKENHSETFSDPNRNEDGSYTQDVFPKYAPGTMEYMNMTVESSYSKDGR